MTSKDLNGLGIVVGILGVGYAIYISAKMDKLCNKIDKRIDDVSNDMEVDIPDVIIEKAVDKAVKREVLYKVEEVAYRAVKDIKNDIHKQVKTAVELEYTDIKKQVSDRVSTEVSKIDMESLRRQVKEEAKDKIVEKFDDNLDELLTKFNGELDSVSKIYKSIANSITGNRDKETILRISN